MQTLLGFFICLVLLSTGSALECEVCGAYGRNCTGTLQTCGAGKDTCTITLSVEKLDSESLPFAREPIYTINKACGSSSDCRTGPKYLTTEPGRGLRSSTTCCVGNACKTVKPQWPPAITKTNGKRCPSCYINSIGTPVKKCNGTQTVNCVGPEDKCLDLEITNNFGTLIIKNIQKGCATQSVCDDFRRHSSGAAQVGITVNKLECKTAPNASS